MSGGTNGRRFGYSRPLFGAAVLSACALCGSYAFSQALNNQPWGFRSGSVISPAGRQLLLDEALFGIHPQHVMIGPDGSVLFVTKGPSGVAVATDQAGNSFAGALRNWSPYFSTPAYGGGWIYGAEDAGPMLTTMSISDWTSAVGPGYEPIFANLLLPQGQNTVNAWTWQVYWLSDYAPAYYRDIPKPAKKSP